MSFKVGDTVVYPHHGAARIEEVETRTIKGEDKTYLVLKVDKGDLTVRVPADNAELVGVRDVVGAEGLERVFEVLRAPHTEEPTNWSRRYKANLEKLASGDVNKVAEVVRDLWRRDRERGLSAGEKRMLAKARQILVSELALAEKTNEDKAEALLDEVLAPEPGRRDGACSVSGMVPPPSRRCRRRRAPVERRRASCTWPGCSGRASRAWPGIQTVTWPRTRSATRCCPRPGSAIWARTSARPARSGRARPAPRCCVRRSGWSARRASPSATSRSRSSGTGPDRAAPRRGREGHGRGAVRRPGQPVRDDHRRPRPDRPRRGHRRDRHRPARADRLRH